MRRLRCTEDLGELFEQRSARVAGANLRMREDRAELREIRPQPGDVELVQGAESSVDGGSEGGGGARRTDDLGEQGIKFPRRRVTQIAACIDSHARPRWL